MQLRSGCTPRDLIFHFMIDGSNNALTVFNEPHSCLFSRTFWNSAHLGRSVTWAGATRGVGLSAWFTTIWIVTRVTTSASKHTTQLVKVTCQNLSMSSLCLRLRTTFQVRLSSPTTSPTSSTWIFNYYNLIFPVLLQFQKSLKTSARHTATPSRSTVLVLWIFLQNLESVIIWSTVSPAWTRSGSHCCCMAEWIIGSLAWSQTLCTTLWSWRVRPGMGSARCPIRSRSRLNALPTETRVLVSPHSNCCLLFRISDCAENQTQRFLYRTDVFHRYHHSFIG